MYAIRCKISFNLFPAVFQSLIKKDTLSLLSEDDDEFWSEVTPELFARVWFTSVISSYIRKIRMTDSISYTGLQLHGQKSGVVKNRMRQCC